MIRHATGIVTQTLNQQKPPPDGDILVPLGTFSFDGTATVEVSNAGTDGFVIADAIVFQPADR
jgi:hypothetical protein